MPVLTCEGCGKAFEVKPYRATTARFCSRSCKSRWVASFAFKGIDQSYKKGNAWARGHKPINAFPQGNIPWNKGMNGIRLSPSSEFKVGPRPEERDEIGAERFRWSHGVWRCFVKTGNPNKWRLRAHVVWEKFNGQIANGKLIHHHDRNPLNDAIENLRCITRSEHIKEHMDDIIHGRHVQPRSA